MKTIKVPLGIVPKSFDGMPFAVNGPDGKPVEIGPVDTFRYLMEFIVTETSPVKDPITGQLSLELKIGKGHQGNARTRRLMDLFKSAPPMSTVDVSDDDWLAVKSIIESKSWGNAVFGACFFEFEDAWINPAGEK
jgi:hypothetical protein